MRIPSLLLLAFSLSAFGQDVTYLVRDLPGLTIHDSMAYGRTFWTNTGNTTWFTAMTAAGTFEIFKTDGTADGTLQVTHGSGVPDSHQGPYLGLVNGKLVYGGIDAGGAGIFALDTNGGDPVLLGRFQLNALVNTSSVVRGSTLFFVGRPTNNAEVEMWSTDGTPAGTTKIDMFPGAAQGAFNFARETHLFSAGSWMFFFGATAQGTGVHRTDGTVANTQLVLPLSQDVLTNATETVYALGNYLLVSLRTGELFSIDATTGAHVQAATTSRFTPLGILGGKLLFDGSGVWTTDGTAAGTHPTDVLPVPNSPLYSGQIVGNRLFFISTATFIPTLYVTDGTGAGTHAIMTINQGSSVGDSGFSIGNFYFFRHDDGVHGMELWRTDGTTAALFADINPGYRTGLDLLTGFTRPDGKVLFAAMNYDSGREPWITDGTTAGTHLLKNLAADGLLSGSSPRLLRASGNSLFFTADLNGGQAIGTSDGTGGGTSANLVDFSTTIQSASAANGHYFFNTLSPDYTSRFYASDGTSAGTTVISEQAGTGQPLPHGFAFLQGANELWFSDGTIAGTHELHAFGSFEAVRIFPGGAVAWIANGPELWKTDGSDAGSIQVVPNPAPTQSILDLTVSGSAIYFIESSYSDHGYRLWRSDGTAAGTTMVKDLGANGLPSFIGATDQMVYLSVGGKLYRSDGTANGTIALPVDGPCLAAASLDGALLFMSSTTIPPFTGSTTITLWRSDGSAAGTTALQVMQPAKTDPGGCGPVVVRGNNAYFSGWDAAHGWELWQSNGTASGTQLTADIYPGTKSSSPQELTLAGNLLFFSADSPNIGRELWAVGPQNISRHRAVRP